MDELDIEVVAMDSSEKLSPPILYDVTQNLSDLSMSREDNTKKAQDEDHCSADLAYEMVTILEHTGHALTLNDENLADPICDIVVEHMEGHQRLSSQRQLIHCRVASSCCLRQQPWCPCRHQGSIRR